VWQVVVYDVAYEWYVEPACRKVGSNQKAGAAVTEFAECTVALALFHLPVIVYAVYTFFGQQGGGALHGFAVVAKDDGGAVAQVAKQLKECIYFIFFCRVYYFQFQPLLWFVFGKKVECFRLLHTQKAGNVYGLRGRGKYVLLQVGQCVCYKRHFFYKAQFQCFVKLIEHQCFYAVYGYIATSYVVGKAAGCTYYQRRWLC